MKNLSILIALILILHAGIRGQSFTAHDISQFDPIVGTINSISIADLNNDNRKDFIVFKASGSDVYLDKLNKQHFIKKGLFKLNHFIMEFLLIIIMMGWMILSEPEQRSISIKIQGPVILVLIRL